MSAYVTKDSGERAQYDSGMVRDIQEGKPRFDLILAADLPYEEQMLTRLAQLLQRGAVKYGERNWEKARGGEELARAKASAMRHLIQWMCGERDEDHAAAVVFNLMLGEFVNYQMGEAQ
ncbi:dATP/dGTP diphosphohydrolase domain-containing protein [Micromonospora sp. WMMD736]|uniref:dATP/dGTP diphosphohydrolase domain-containing protein n=1 Tax=Micromonospora sp. WMMD736 TaxID=3404112 RepID=UPI003B92E941